MDAGDRYTEPQVSVLMGLHETWRPHATIADVLSWAHDPGGMWTIGEFESRDTAWMGRRGPLHPGSELVGTLIDFQRAMRRLRRDKELDIKQQAVVALLAFQFSIPEICAALDLRQPVIEEIVYGRVVEVERDADGKRLRTIHAGGLAGRLTALMNNEPEDQDRPPPKRRRRR